MLVDALAVGMTIDQFWAATPAELAAIMEAHARRERRTMESLAWHAANLMNAILSPWSKRKPGITVNKLLGRSRPLASFSGNRDADNYVLEHNRRVAAAMRRRDGDG